MSLLPTLLPKEEIEAIERELGTRYDMASQLARFSLALHRFVWAFAESLHIPQLLDRLNRALLIALLIARHPLRAWRNR